MRLIRHLSASGAVLLGMACGITAGAEAATIQFQEGASNAYVTDYAGTADTEFNSAASSTGFSNGNIGGADYMRSNQTTTWEQRRALLRFDLSALAGQGLSVTGATLHLAVLDGGSVDLVPFDVFGIAAANAGWGEGANTSIVSDANVGEATWNYRAHATTPWAGSAGLSTPDVDYASTPVASGVYDPADPDGTVLSLVLPPALIQSWIDSPAANAGLLILTDNNPATSYNRFAQFATSEHATAAWRPMLEINAAPVPEPASVGVVSVTGLLLLACRRRDR